MLNYKSFSSVALGKIVVLNDLFVSPQSRKKGIAEILIKKSFEFAEQIGAVRVDLKTAMDNETAQSIYEKIGFKRDNKFYSYSYSLK